MRAVLVVSPAVMVVSVEPEAGPIPLPDRSESNSIREAISQGWVVVGPAEAVGPVVGDDNVDVSSSG